MDFFGENTGLYFYSAVFQGNMALLALSGIFAVFKLQQINTQQQLQSRVIVDLTNICFHRQESPLSWVQPDNIEAIKERILDLQKQREQGQITEGRAEWSQLKQLEEKVFPRITEYEGLNDTNSTIRNSLSRPFGLTLIVIVIALAFLIFAYALTSISQWIILISMLATVFLNVCALMANVRFVFTALDIEVPAWARVFGRICKEKSVIASATSSPK